MRRAAIALTLLLVASGCDFRAKQAAEAKHLEMERTMAELDARITRLEAENAALRADIAAMRASSLSASSSTTPFEGGCTGSGDTFAIKRSDVDAIFNDTKTLASGARLVPAFENGVAIGFKLFSIRPGSLYASCGFMNGDTIKTVNGYDIHSPDKALEAYSKTKTASRAVFEIQRTGKPFVLTINVEG